MAAVAVVRAEGATEEEARAKAEVERAEEVMAVGAMVAVVRVAAATEEEATERAEVEMEVEMVVVMEVEERVSRWYTARPYKS